MKRCPECGRNYNDDSMSFCLDDGFELLFGPASTNEPATAILSVSPAVAGVFKPHADQSESKTAILQPPATADGSDSTEGHSLSAHRAAKPLAILVVAVLVFVGGFFGYRYLSTANSKQIESIAVMPFENGSGDVTLDYLSDGVSESLIDKLSRLPGLKVIARSSSFKFRGSQWDINDVANKLGVQAVISGRVMKVGEKLMVHVEMVDASANRQIWSEQFERNVSDLLSVQRDVSDAAIQQLRAVLSANQKVELGKASAANDQAYELFLKAQFLHHNAESGDDLKSAAAMLEKALSLDTSFARACAELADIYDDLSYGKVKDYLPKAEITARRAILLDPNLAEAHLTMAKLLRNKWNWREAETEYKMALALNPNLAALHESYSLFLNFTNRPDMAIAEARKSVELDPLYGSSSSKLAFALLIAHRWDEAVAEANRVLSAVPNDPGALSILVWVDDAQGRYSEAVSRYRSLMSESGETNGAKAQLAYLLARSGDRDGAKLILSELKASKKLTSAYDFAELYAALGDNDSAFEYLEAAYKEHFGGLYYIRVDPALESIRADPRYGDLVLRMNFSIDEKY